MTRPLPPWLGIVAVLAVLALAMVAIRRAQLRLHLSPEVTRKALHVAMSAVALALPWVFDRTWPVVVLAALSVGAMVAVRLVPVLRADVGSVLHEVGRQSIGDLCFPVALALLFWLTADAPVLYSIPVLLLGLADPAAALTGARHGLAPYATVEGVKSREGSVAFAFVAFLCVHVPLLLFTPIGRPESLWIACVVALLAMIVEAVSWQGLDNLFVPIGTYAILVRLLTLDAPDLAGHFVALLGLLGLAAVLRSETTVGGAGVFGAALIAYLTWALGGIAWLIPPALVFVLYARMWPAAREIDGLPHDPSRRPHTSHNVFSVASVGMLWLIVSRAAGVDLLYPYALAWACTLAFLGVERMRTARPAWGVFQLAWRAAWRCTLVAVAPVVLVVWSRVALGSDRAPALPVETTALYVGVGLVATWGAAAILARFYDEIEARSTDFEGRVYRASVVAPLSALGLLALLFR